MFTKNTYSTTWVLRFWYTIGFLLSVQEMFFLESYIDAFDMPPERKAKHVEDELVAHLHWCEGQANICFALCLMAVAQCNAQAQQKAIQYALLPDAFFKSYSTILAIQKGLIPSAQAAAPVFVVSTIAIVSGLLTCYGPLKPKILIEEENQNKKMS